MIARRESKKLELCAANSKCKTNEQNLKTRGRKPLEASERKSQQESSGPAMMVPTSILHLCWLLVALGPSQRPSHGVWGHQIPATHANTQAHGEDSTLEPANSLIGDANNRKLSSLANDDDDNGDSRRSARIQTTAINEQHRPLWSESQLKASARPAGSLTASVAPTFDPSQHKSVFAAIQAHPSLRLVSSVEGRGIESAAERARDNGLVSASHQSDVMSRAER